MFTTKKLYEENPNLLVCSANVLDVMEENNLSVVVLDQTVFRPENAPAQKNEGGVPDRGLIESEQKRFHVIRVERADDTLRHIGTFEGDPFEVDEVVTCTINEEFSRELKDNKID